LASPESCKRKRWFSSIRLPSHGLTRRIVGALNWKENSRVPSHPPAAPGAVGWKTLLAATVHFAPDGKGPEKS